VMVLLKMVISEDFQDFEVRKKLGMERVVSSKLRHSRK